jgi:hypothetical protein
MEAPHLVSWVFVVLIVVLKSLGLEDPNILGFVIVVISGAQ